MALIKRARTALHNWLYLTPDGFGLAQWQHGNSGLPQLHCRLWHAETDPLAQAEQLADRIAELADGRLHILLGEGYYQLLLVDVPDVPADEAEAALRLKAADLLNYDLDDASLEVIFLPAQAYHGRTRMAFVIATRKTPLRQWALALAKRGLTLTTVDIDQLQLRNLALRMTDQPAHGLLHFRADHCQLLLTYDHELVLTRRFDIGYEDLGADAQGDALVLEGQTDIQRDSLVLELRRTFDYYESQLGLGSLHQLSLSGWPGTAGMIDDLSQTLGLRFRPLRLEDLIDLPTPVPEPMWPLAGTAFRGVSL